jgi:hypothetical protein
MDAGEINNLRLKNDPVFWARLKTCARSAGDVEESFLFASLLKRKCR